MVVGGDTENRKEEEKKDRQINGGREVNGGQKEGFWKTSHLELHSCSLFTELISLRVFSLKHTRTGFVPKLSVSAYLLHI